MKKTRYIVLLIICIFVNANKIVAKDKVDMASCTYTYSEDGVGFTIKTILSGKKSTKNNKISYSSVKMRVEEEVTDNTVKMVNNMLDHNVLWDDKQVGVCPNINFMIYKPVGDFCEFDMTYVTQFEYQDGLSSGNLCNDNGCKCIPVTGLSGTREILDPDLNSTAKSEEPVEYCSNTYYEKKIDTLVTIKIISVNENLGKIFEIYDDNTGEKLGSNGINGEVPINNDTNCRIDGKVSFFDDSCPSNLILDCYSRSTDIPEKKTFESTSGETQKLIKEIYGIIKIIVPVLIVILSIIDFLKVVLLSDEKDYKNAWSRLIKRIFIGIIFFIVPIIVSLLINLSGIDTAENFIGIFK